MGRQCVWVLAITWLLTACSTSESPAPVDSGNEAEVLLLDVLFDVGGGDAISEPLDHPGEDVDANPCDGGRVLCGEACVETQTDPRHCGSCATDCTMLPGVEASRVRCLAGHCELMGACLPGRAHCSTNSADGCEADITTAARCGSCTTSCDEPTPMCTMTAGDAGTPGYACASGCSAMTPTRCDGRCVDTMTDARHCGGCGRACPVAENGSASCTTGACELRCNPGYHRCGARCLADTSLEGCGTTCTPCSPPPPNGTATCDGAACGFTCNAGFHRCGERCIANASLDGCGMACTPCPVPTNGMATCDGMNCGIRCDAGFRACGDRCLPLTSVEACGPSCTPCPPPPEHASATCDGSTCGFRCSAGYHRCGDRCVSDLDVTSCGASCTPCFVPTNGRATCDGTRCGVVCNTSFERCDERCVDARTDPLHCGGCGRTCAFPGASALCRDGRCVRGACASGRGDCNGLEADGCETDLTTDTNCGACGVVCASGRTCRAGVCVSFAPVCGADNFTVRCPEGDFCAENSTCVGGGRCRCNADFTPVTCSGTACEGRCTYPNWWCVPAFCGAGNFNVPCADPTRFCPTNSTCRSDSRSCDCNFGYEPVTCGGTSCDLTFCAYPNWWCRPRRF